MKKVFLILSVLAVISVSSCKKNYTCTCTNNTTGATTTTTVSASSSTDAIVQCNNQTLNNTATCAY
jgi:hypothetical protein